MRGSTIVAFSLLVCSPLASAPKPLPEALPEGVRLIVLKKGDTLEGEVVDDFEGKTSIRLRTGIVIRLDNDEIEAIEEFKTFEEEMESHPKATKDLDLGKIFETVDPTPTPLAIVPIDLRINYKMRRTKDPKSLRPIPPVLSLSPLSDSPRLEPKRDKENGPYGRVAWAKGLSKLRHTTESWRPALGGAELIEGDQFHTLTGRAEIRSFENSVLRLHPETRTTLFRREVHIEQGKAWVQFAAEGDSVVAFGDMTARLRDARVMVEYLKSGVKFVLAEGEATLAKAPEGEIVRGGLQAPLSLLLDVNRSVIAQSEPAPGDLADWEEWESEAPESLATEDLFVTSVTSEAGSRTPEAMILQQISDLTNLAEAINDYYLDVGRFPEEKRPFLKGLGENPGNSDWRGPYLGETVFPLLDQWGSELIYRIKTDPISAEVFVEIYSLGPNKQFQEGEGDDMGIRIERPGR